MYLKRPMAESEVIPAADLELESILVGPATRMIVLEANALGCLRYQFGPHPARELALSGRYARKPLGLLDMARSAALLDPVSNRLEALVGFATDGSRIFPMREQWGQWRDEAGTTHTARDIVISMRQSQLPVTVDEAKGLLSFEFKINIYQREIFAREVHCCFREGAVRHVMELFFSIPTGEFRLAVIKIEDVTTHRARDFFDLYGFPLIWPTLTATMEPEPPSPSPSPTAYSFTAAPRHRPETRATPPKSAEVKDATSSAIPGVEPVTPQTAPAPGSAPDRKRALGARVSGSQSAPLTAKDPAAAPVAPPLPRTTGLSLPDLLDTLALEGDLERRWRMIEANLMLGRPERTYPLLLGYADMIAERVILWAPLRLKTAFAQQPGSVLIGIMHDWNVNQVLVLVEDNPEAPQIMEWLREREIERLLKVDPGRDPVSAEEARRALRIDRYADEPAIKKTWRTLLGFMNADHGRSEERAIHRKKDEIAKHLQVARNLLLKAR